MASALDTARLRALLRTARLARSAEPADALPAIATAMGEALGWQTVVVNLYRPACDDLEVAAVHGRPEVSQALLGTRASREAWMRLLDPLRERSGTRYLPHGHAETDDGMAAYVPPLPVTGDPKVWHPQDLLLAPMRDGHDELLGVISVDEPVSGLRPGEDELGLLAVAASYVGLALEQRAERSRMDRHARAVEELLRVSAILNAGHSTDAVLSHICAAIADALGFGKVALFMADADGMLRPQAEVGWHERGGVPLRELRRDLLDELLSAMPECSGCRLADAETALRALPRGFPRPYSSESNGRGPHAWRHHWLIVPLRDVRDQLIGAIWADDPTDRLLPSTDRLRALRLFADQAVNALQAAGRLERMRAMAERDPLTDLANRRALRAFLARTDLDAGLALLICDLDHFKRVNDELGHAAGDAVLVRFAALLARAARSGDLAVRMGGEEFALVLPGTGPTTALEVAERVRRAAREHFADLPHPLTVSAGVSAAADGRHGVTRLLREADQALYTAKRSGRDCCVLHREPSDGAEDAPARQVASAARTSPSARAGDRDAWLPAGRQRGTFAN